MALRGSVTGVVRVPAGDAFAFVTNIDRLPEWNALITQVVEPLPNPGPGGEWVVELRSMGNTWCSRSQVREYDQAARRFAYRSCTADGNPSYGDWTWEISPDPQGASVTVSWDLHPRTFWRRVLLAPMRNRQLRGEVRESLRQVELALTRATETR